MATVGVVAGIALLGIGVASVKMAGDFQQSVNRLRTGAGDTKDSFSSLSAGIERVAVVTGTLTKPLADAMYLILSSGQRGAQAYNTLEVAAKGAVIEQAKVADVANVLSGVMTNYGTKLFSATDYMNGLITAVAHGKITLQDLSVAMGPIDPIARDLGISFAATAAAMTTQTNAMIPASRAATGLRFMLLALENPTTKAKNEMESLGLSTVKVADEMKVSLPGALQLIYDAAKKAGPEGSVPFNRAIADMVGGIRGFTAFTALTGSHMKEFIANVNLITDAMKRHNAEVQGWEIAQGNFNVQMDRAKAALQVVGIEIGTRLLPLLGGIITGLIPVIQGFGAWATSANGLVAVFQGVIKWVQTFFGELNSNGALKELVTIFKNLGDIVHNIVITALQTVGVLFGTTASKADAAGGSAKAVAGAFKTILGVVEVLSGVLKAVTGWFADAGLKGILLRDALMGVALAFAAIKITGLIAQLVTLATVVIPVLLVRIGLIAPAAAVASAAWGTAFIGMLGPIGLVVAAIGGLYLAAKSLKDNGILPDAPKSGPDWVTHINSATVALDTAKRAAIEWQKQVDIGYRDMAALYDLERSWAGYDPGSNLPFFNEAIVKAVELKSHLDDLKGPFVPQFNWRPMTAGEVIIANFKAHLDDLEAPIILEVGTQNVTAAQLKVIIFKSHLDDLKIPEAPSIGLVSINAAIIRTMVLKSQLDDTTIPRTPSIGLRSINAAIIDAMVLKSRLDDTIGPFVPSIGLRSINAAIVDAMVLKSRLDDTTGTYYSNVVTNYTSTGSYPMRRYATGLLDSPFGHMAIVGEKGPEMMWVPKGASIFPNGQGPTALSSATLGMNMNSGGAGQQPVNVLVYIDGAQIGQYAGRRVADGIRVSTGIRR